MKKQETRKTGVKVEECSLTALTWAREGDREKVRPRCRDGDYSVQRPYFKRAYLYAGVKVNRSLYGKAFHSNAEIALQGYFQKNGYPSSVIRRV